MSVLSLMKQKCNIKRKKNTPTYDDLQNEVVTWESIYTNQKCYMCRLSETSQVYKQTPIGDDAKGDFLLMLPPTVLVFKGDIVDVPLFSSDIYYVRDASNMMNPRTGNVSHIEVILDIRAG